MRKFMAKVFIFDAVLDLRKQTQILRLSDVLKSSGPLSGPLRGPLIGPLQIR
jgi:hypothetical protein